MCTIWLTTSQLSVERVMGRATSNSKCRHFHFVLSPSKIKQRCFDRDVVVCPYPHRGAGLRQEVHGWLARVAHGLAHWHPYAALINVIISNILNHHLFQIISAPCGQVFESKAKKPQLLPAQLATPSKSECLARSSFWGQQICCLLCLECDFSYWHDQSSPH